MQFKVVAFIAALFAVANATCVSITFFHRRITTPTDGGA
jgi:hypothetical protein